ncbi:24050_t:CDS:2 [Gigaspora rosea]|nr:24050_t:CDS:2 [Gigaspora rosea]
MSHTTSQEQRDANTARMHRKRAVETGEQTNQRRQCDARTHRRHCVEKHGEQRLNCRQQNATAKRQRCDEETEDQSHNRNRRDAAAHRQQRKKNPRLYNLAHSFSENANINYPIPHKIDVTSSVTCNHCNALKLPIETRTMLQRTSVAKSKFIILHLPSLPLVPGLIMNLPIHNQVFTPFVFKLHYRANTIPNSNLNLSTIQALKDMLDEVNPYVINFRHISYLPPENFRNLSMLIHTNIPGLDQRTHNAPSSSEVAAIWVKNDTLPGVIQECDIILRTHMNQLLRISEFSGCYDPLAYSLLFPHGEQGWAPRRIPYRNIPFSNESIDIDESPNNESIEIDESPNNESIDIDESPNNDRNDNELESVNTIKHRKFVTAMQYYA